MSSPRQTERQFSRGRKSGRYESYPKCAHCGKPITGAEYYILTNDGICPPEVYAWAVAQGKAGFSIHHRCAKKV